MRRAPLLIISVCVIFGCHTSLPDKEGADLYCPKLVVTETNPFTGRPEKCFKFTTEQMRHFTETKLDTNRFVSYVEQRWPVERLRAFCVASNKWPSDFMQKHVAYPFYFATDLYKGSPHTFDRIHVVVNEDDGNETYHWNMGTNWHRWTYTIDVDQGTNSWEILEHLPNNFMDSLKK